MGTGRRGSGPRQSHLVPRSWSPPRLPLLLVALVVGLLAMSLAGGPARAAGGCAFEPSWGANNGAQADEVVRLVNQHRAGLGLRSLAVSPSLTRSAVWKSGHMLANGYFGHADPAPPAARGVAERLRACGYTGGTWGENIAKGQQGAQAVMSAWLGSSGHRANIENGAFSAVGVGAVSRAGAPIHWTQNFGVAGDDSQPAPPPSTPLPPPSVAAPDPTPAPASGPPTLTPTPSAGARTPDPVAGAPGGGAVAPATNVRLKPAITLADRQRPDVVWRRATLASARSGALRFVSRRARHIVVAVRSESRRGQGRVVARLHCDGRRIAAGTASRRREAIFRVRIAAGRCAVMTIAGPQRVRVRTVVRALPR